MIHDRMPMIIDPGSWADWLDPANNDVADLRALLVPAAVGGLITYPVSTAVNSVRNNGPQLIEPVSVGPAGALASAAPGAGNQAAAAQRLVSVATMAPERCSRPAGWARQRS